MEEGLADDTCTDWLERCLVGDQKSDTEDSPSDLDNSNYGDKSNEDRKGTYTRLRSASKPHSTPLTLKWLEENYEIADGVCIPRSTLYVHYLDYCEKHDTQPVNAASFGKIIRQQFPQLTTRRLGTRGQSKYHYYGIGVRESSQYYEVSYSAKGIQSSVDGKKDTAKQIIAYSPRSKLGTLLPDFPEIKDIKLPEAVAEDKVLTFIMMYRTHCQRILDTVIRANFDEVQSFLLHFWQGMPTHIKSILECKVLITLVGVCDSILYRAIANVLMPTVLQPLPESLTQVIRKFSIQLDEWLHQALDSLPYNLQKVKFDLARRFSQVLKRQTSLNHLCQAARTVIHSADITSQMLDDWINVDLNSIIKQTLYTMDNHCDLEQNVIVKLTRDFEMLLEDQAPLESYIEWLDCMVEQCVIQKSQKQLGTLKKTARQFLLMWSCFGTRVIRDMTLHSAPSFGSFHLLHLMFDEYVLYMVENLHNQEKGDELLRAVRGEQNLDFLDEIILMEPPTGSTQSRDVNRSSVIRVPDCNISTSGRHGILPEYTTLAETPCYQQTSVCSDQRNDSLASNPFPAFPAIGTSSFSQETFSRPKSSFTNHNSQTVLGGHLPAELLAGSNNAVNTYDWYDWSNSGQQTSGAPNMMLNKVPNMDQHLLYKSPPVFEYSDNQHFSPFCNDVDLNLKRNTPTENQSFLQTTMQKRKMDDSSKIAMSDMYAYQHVTNVI